MANNRLTCNIKRVTHEEGSVPEIVQYDLSSFACFYCKSSDSDVFYCLFPGLNKSTKTKNNAKQ